MLRLSLFLLVTFVFAETNSTKELFDSKKLEFYYKSGVRDYRIGSYYDAINEFNYLAKFPQNPYYLDSLFYLAKTYLQIGKRTGEKKYLWLARDFLNLYLVKGGKKDARYYYTKAYIYEILGFYERALSNYKIALKKSPDKKMQLRAIIGILRNAVWLGKLDLATKYFVILNIEELSKEQKEEFEFLKGMYNFVKGDYASAIAYLQKSYRNYESFLIENPEYYYIVAENAYRIGDFTFALRLFRRVLNYIKNKNVIQKALLRLGDIDFLQGDIRSSLGYYYRLIKDFGDSSYAMIAKLKILYMMQEDPKINYYIKKYFSDAQFVKEPEKFVTTILVKNRNNYVGIFALANFGRDVFELGNAKLFKRLSWELSLLSINKLKYEHKEYFRKLWRNKIDRIDPKFLKDLFSANPDFFFAVFNKKELLSIAKRLEKSGDKKLILRFYKQLANRYTDSNTLFVVVAQMYDLQKFDDAARILSKVDRHNCTYKLWKAKLCYAKGGDCKNEIDEYVKSCNRKDIFYHIFEALSKNDLSSFLKKYGEQIKQDYQDPVVHRFVKASVDIFLQKKRYDRIIALLTPLVSQVHDCYLKSILALSYVRSGKIDLAKSILENIKGCEGNWYKIAKNALLDAELARKVRNVGEN